MQAPPFPVLRLKPKADARRMRHGHPWAWADDLVLDRRSRAIAAGDLAVLEDANRVPLAVGVATVEARIGFRVLERDADAIIDLDWLTAKLTNALRLREALYDAPYYRLVHAEGDGLPGLIVDRFGDTLVIQPNAVWLDKRLPGITASLQEITGCKTLVMNGTSRARAQEGLPETLTLLAGSAPDEPLDVPMNGAIYKADVMGGQKTGLFYDQRPNHAFVAGLAREARVLDVFSHVGGFALAALAGGAAEALAVDASAPALALAEAGAGATGVAGRFATRAGDAFDTMTALAAEGTRFDLVVCDPPAFAPSKQALQQGLRAYERVARLAADLVVPGGVVMLCSCSHAADLAKFRASCVRGLGRAGRDPRLIHTGFAGPDHPQHPALTETGYLKALAFRLMP
jgi:23S rRNA (cytosine1962-C5)-methyltransferase